MPWVFERMKAVASGRTIPGRCSPPAVADPDTSRTPAPRLIRLKRWHDARIRSGTFEVLYTQLITRDLSQILRTKTGTLRSSVDFQAIQASFRRDEISRHRERGKHTVRWERNIEMMTSSKYPRNIPELCTHDVACLPVKIEAYQTRSRLPPAPRSSTTAASLKSRAITAFAPVLGRAVLREDKMSSNSRIRLS
ncbi:hypothetical protein OH76DRAFT_1096179 [Lentinus brumalis]|uniref:Uncharacterized protein n=1 Tax=Lentinus brumalis TaxID=2498619 RepID=A0A371CW74_9APHY|nr:hypothetical protein OH76DRAFT_1096179 [Polyporus brumalis]